MNRIHIVGRLTADPELRSTVSDKQVCSFTVAVSRRFNRDETDFFPVKVWKDLAVNCNKYLTKGSQVGVSGPVRLDNYEDKNGVKKLAVSIQADEVEFLSMKSSEENQEKPTKSKSSAKESHLQEIDDTDMPF